MRDRHWKAITEKTEIYFEVKQAGEEVATDRFPLEPKSKYFTLAFIIERGMSMFADDINQISGGATQEEQIEKSFNQIESDWSKIEYTAAPYVSKGIGG